MFELFEWRVCKWHVLSNYVMIVKGSELVLIWGGVQYIIEYKIAVYCYKCLNNAAPSYLCCLLEKYGPNRSLKSSDKHLLKVKIAKRNKFGDRSFSVYGPSVWNSLPLELRQAPSEIQFKKDLKTFLFTKHL